MTACDRLTQYAHGGGCACKIPPGELEEVVAGLGRHATATGELLVGLDDGDDAAVVADQRRHGAWSRPPTSSPRSSTTPYDWGRIAAANALSDVYAMGGTPLVAVNLRRLAARRAARSSCAAEVLRGGLDVARAGRLPRRAAGTASTTRSRSTAWR